MWIYPSLSQISSFASLCECRCEVLVQVPQGVVGPYERSLWSETRFSFSSSSAAEAPPVPAVPSWV